MTREDAISRKAAIDAIWNGINMDIYTREVKEVLEALPPVTPQQKMGHWIATDEEPHEDFECDGCGYTVSTCTANIKPHMEYKYCPNCGAKMQEV